MRIAIILTLSLFLAVVAATPPVFIKVMALTDGIYTGVTEAFYSFIEPPVPPVTVRFVGDVMLARHVETLMKRHGSAYPYARLPQTEDTVWLGNFEAAVPRRHTQTKNYTMNFSVDPVYLPALKAAGFTHLGLANNHTFDFGPEGYKATREQLDAFEIFGHPQVVSKDSTTIIELPQGTIGVIALSVVGTAPDLAAIKTQLSGLIRSSDAQIAYVHWGEEYQPTHNNTQENLAHFLIDNGIDAVIGHHPHVVQDIAMYKDVPIFYSLGNFIFDQYFSAEVMNGLAVDVLLTETGLVFDVLPFTSSDLAAAPHLMTEDESRSFFLALRERSDVDPLQLFLRQDLVLGE